MSKFAVGASWQLEAQVSDELLAAGADRLPLEDSAACVWRDETDPMVVQLSFDVEAASLDSAIDLSLNRVGRFSDFGVPGTVTSLELVDGTDLWTWTPDE